MSSQGSYAAEGKLISWLKPAGSKVNAGEAVAEIETEKVTYEVEASASGILHPVAEPGVDLPLETVIGFVLQDGEFPPEREASEAPLLPMEPAARTSAGSEKPIQELRASPLAKRLAREHGIDLMTVVGSGPDGRIIEADVMAAKMHLRENSAGIQSPARKIHSRLPLTGMRGTIARRMRHSLSTAASLTITREVQAEMLVAARQRMQIAMRSDLPYDALFAKLLGDSLREHPQLNAVVEEDVILLLEEINIGFAVPVPGGLLVPVLHNVASRSLPEITTRTIELRKRALTGALRPDDVAGGTATLSNLGAAGIDAFTPILNFPESLVLGVGRIVERVIARAGQIIAAPTCVLSLTFDHRVADGVPAAQLLQAIAQRMTDVQYLNGLV